PGVQKLRGRTHLLQAAAQRLEVGRRLVDVEEDDGRSGHSGPPLGRVASSLPAGASGHAWVCCRRPARVPPTPPPLAPAARGEACASGATSLTARAAARPWRRWRGW